MKQRNVSEIQALYEQYAFLIYKRCERLLRSGDEAKDAMQEVFMQLLTHYDSIKDKQRLVPWIYTAARNHCFNLLRFRKKFSSPAILDYLPSKEQDHDERFDRRQLLSLLIREQNPRIRDAVYFTYIEELEQKDIYRITGQSPATIRRNLARFRESAARIRKRLGVL